MHLRDPFRGAHRDYKYRAKKKGIDFFLTPGEVRAIITSPCWYCGSDPEERVNKSYGAHRVHGIDRVDNTKGYSPDNVVTCCWRCNCFKASLSVEEFLDHVRRIVEWQKKR